MCYASDVYVVMKTGDFKRLRSHPAIAGADTVSFGEREGIGYTMIFLYERNWYGEWEQEKRIQDPRIFVQDQEAFMDELKKLDFFDFVRTGETSDDLEEYHSSGTRNLLWAEPIQGDFPFVTFEADVFQPD